VPTYNRLTLLQEAVRSVAVQCAGDCEIIVVDDGSTDGTAAWLEAETAEGRLRAVHQANRGPSAARNAGARTARTSWLIFLDSDDVWFPWTLSVFRKTLGQHPSLSLVAFSFLEFTEASDLPPTPMGYDVDVRPDYLSSSSVGYFAGAGMWAVRREAFSRVGGFSEGMHHAEDHDFALRLGTEADFAMIKRPIMVGHRRHGAGLSDETEGLLTGVRALVEREKAGLYPGGRERSSDRKRIIARHARASVVSSLGSQQAKEAWVLYRATFGWQLADRRLKFLALAPAVGLWKALRSCAA
jgi:hypothetical protein